MAATVLTMAVAPASQLCFGRVQAARTSVRVTPGARVVCMAAPRGSSGPAIGSTGDKVEAKIDEAQEVCAGDSQSEECATAWDAVEAATAEKAKNKGKGDPLEEYCEDNPEADECRVYSD